MGFCTTTRAMTGLRSRQPVTGGAPHGSFGVAVLSRMLVRTALWTAGLAALLFGAAGTLDWPAAWVFVGLSGGVAVVMGAALARHDRALLAERLAPPFQRDQADWDRIVIAGAMIAWLGWIVLMALDAARYRWSTMAPGLQLVGGVALL